MVYGYRCKKIWFYLSINCFKNPSKEKAKGAYKKFLGAYQRLATEQILFVNKVGEPDLVQMAGNPAKLIPKLYEHQSITQTDPGLPRPG